MAAKNVTIKDVNGDINYPQTLAENVFATNGQTVQQIVGELSTAGYTFKGVATASTNPGTPTSRVFYLADGPGTYTNFSGLTVEAGCSVILWNGSAWSVTKYLPLVNDLTTGGTDKALTAEQGKTLKNTKFEASDLVNDLTTGGSTKPLAAEQGKVLATQVSQLGQQVIYDVSANNDGATFASLSALLSSENLSTLIPIAVRCGGMSIRFAQTSGNKYVQYRLMSDTFNTTVANWQGVDNEPTAGSKNLVTSDGVQHELFSLKTKDDYLQQTIPSSSVASFSVYNQNKIPYVVNIENTSINNITWGNLTGAKTYIIPIDSYDFISFLEWSSSGGYGSFITDANGVVLSGYSAIHESLITVEVAEGAKYLYYCIPSLTDDYILKTYVSYIPKIYNQLSSVKDGLFETKTKAEVLSDYTIYASNKVLNDVTNYIGQNISSVPQLALSNRNVIKIPISGYSLVSFAKFVSSQGNGSVITDANDIVLSAYTYTSYDDDKLVIVEVPSNGAYLYYTIYDNNDCVFRFLKSDENKAALTEIDNNVNTLSQDVYNIESQLKTEVIESKSEVVSKYEMYGTPNHVLSRVTAHVGDNISSIELGSVQGTTMYKIPISDHKVISFRVYTSSQGNGSAITDNNGIILSAWGASTGYYTTIKLPSNAAYLYYAVYDSDAYTFGYFESRLDEMEADINDLVSISPLKIESSNLGCIKPTLLSGKIQNGKIVANRNYVTTTPIYGNFYIELNDDYRIYSASLIYMDGTIVSDYYLPATNYNGIDAWTYRKTYGCYYLPSNYGVLVTIICADEGDISPDDCIIKKFSWLNDSNYTKVVPSINQSAYWAAWRRSRLIQKVEFTALKKLPARESLNTDYYLQGKSYLGIPYSGARQYDKFVGCNVTIRTFISSLYNKRSLMYTENLRTGEHSSQYNITYVDDSEACTYYGIVCSAFTAYVLGLDIVYPSNKQGDITGMTKIENFTADDIQPMDVIVTAGHVSIVTDILKDKNDNKTYICWAEATPPLTKVTPYTLTGFMERFNREKGSETSAGLYRYTNLSSLTVEDNTNLVEIDIDDYVLGKWHNDVISTFAGDYAVFKEGDSIYINAKPNNGEYVTLRITKNGGTYQDVDIRSYQEDADGYIDVNISSLNLSSGLYEAILIDTHSNSSSPTHFEVVELELNVASVGSTRNFTFSSDASLIAICIQNIKGINYYVKYLTQEEISSGEASITWEDNSKYAKLYAKATYGMVSTRVPLSV